MLTNIVPDEAHAFAFSFGREKSETLFIHVYINIEH